MTPKIKREDYDRLELKRVALTAKRNSTHDAHARIELTKKINRLSAFLDNVEIVL